jgi:hypothetical protein
LIHFDTKRAQADLVKMRRLSKNETPFGFESSQKDCLYFWAVWAVILVGKNMEKGFNSDIMFKGMNFHIQTEDWGSNNPYLVSRVYQNGAVIKSLKTPYSEVLDFARLARQRIDTQAIRLALRQQHEKILDLLLSGQLF